MAQMTEQDVMRLSGAVNIQVSKEECGRITAHLNNQLLGFSALEKVNTDGVTPMFGLNNNEAYKVERRD